MKKTIRRGDVYWVNLDPPIGRHPVLIIQNDIGNMYAPTVIVVTITSIPTDKKYPTDVLLPEGILPKKNSRVLTATILTIPKDVLGEYLTTVPEEIMRKVDFALMTSFDLEKYLGNEENRHFKL
ncbi:MAG: type II toxin-antitoxin system PemK/MazF family toxin [Candidatus Aerophobetes bacterium]|nr:type II toxin-antitoxin system PemK/MazF family toxin [Candidatus Aerophobetes bacterium]